MLKTSGLMSRDEAAAIERSLERVVARWPGQRLVIAEVGLWDGTTSRGIRDWFAGRGVEIEHHCFDSGKESPAAPYDGCVYHLGDSLETVPAFKGTVHWALVDGCHCVSHAIADVANLGFHVALGGGEMAVHDTQRDMDPGRDYQGHGPRDNPEFTITGVRFALAKLDLLPPFASARWELAEEVRYRKYDGRTGVIIYRKK